ncbi:MAG: hypothetical protein Q9176_003918 [Flavoplaca citrina]
MSKDPWKHGNMIDDHGTRAPISSPRSWPADALSVEVFPAERPLQTDGMTRDACPKDGSVEALHLECAGPDEKNAHADNEDQSQDGDDDEDKDREFNTVSDGESASDRGDFENESFKSGSLERCECGYINH